MAKRPAKPPSLLERLQSGEDRALSEALSRVQEDPDGHRKLLEQVYELAQKAKDKNHAQIFGITGPPGAGKSTLLKTLLKNLATEEVGVLLVDPSSPFSGGALLGDRLRMDDSLGPRHFVRSVGTRGQLGGLCIAARDLVRLFLAAGKRYIFVETVGVGQSEHDVMNLADLTVVVLTADSGDVIQTLKAGLMEIADIFVVNKADHPHAKRMVADLEGLETGQPVYATMAVEGTGVVELWQALVQHAPRQLSKVQYSERLAREVSQLVGFGAETHVYHALLHTKTGKKHLKDLLSGDDNPYRLSSTWRRKIL